MLGQGSGPILVCKNGLGSSHEEPPNPGRSLAGLANVLDVTGRLRGVSVRLNELDCSWVGSLDFNFGESSGFPLGRQKVIFFAEGSLQQPSEVVSFQDCKDM